MLKLKVFEEDFGITILQNDRGDWSVKQQADAPIAILEGFGGEDYITIQFMMMQSFKTSVVVTFASVDSYIETKSRTVVGWEVSEAVNEMIEEWYKERGIIETEEEFQAHMEASRARMKGK